MAQTRTKKYNLVCLSCRTQQSKVTKSNAAIRQMWRLCYVSPCYLSVATTKEWPETPQAAGWAA